MPPSDHGVKPVTYYEGLPDRLHEAAILFGKPAVIGWYVGLVPTNAPAVTDQFAGVRPNFTGLIPTWRPESFRLADNFDRNRSNLRLTRPKK